MLAMLLAVALTQTPSKEFWAVDIQAMSVADKALVQSVQGLANRKGPLVWLKVGGMSEVLMARMKAKGWKERATDDPWALAAAFRTSWSGAVLCRVGDESHNRAATLAGLKNLLVVDESLQAKAKSAGCSVVADVRESTPVVPGTTPNLAKTLAVEQPPGKVGFLRDYAIKRRALCFSAADSSERRQILASLSPGAWVLGWGPDEYRWIEDLSRSGAIGVAADWCANLSAMESLAGIVHPPKPPRSEPEPKKGERIVAFVLSDGDNVQWLTGGMPLDKTYYANPLRGTFKMTWEVSPLLSKLAPQVLDYIFENATPLDGFVAAGAPGYSYAALAPSRSVAARQTGPLLQSAGLRVVGVINSNGGDLSDAKEILELPQVDGVVYKDYSPYHGKHGGVWWLGGKPCVGYRFSLWEGLDGCSPAQVAAAVAKMPSDPTDAGSYALITVHAWSFGASGGPIAAVKRTIDALPPGTRVVTAPELIAWLRKFVTPR